MNARIDKKAIKAKKNSHLFVTGEMVHSDDEFKIDIQDIIYLPMSIANIENTSDTSISSLYAWKNMPSSSKIPAEMITKRM